MADTEESQKTADAAESKSEKGGHTKTSSRPLSWAPKQTGPSQLLDYLYMGNYVDAGNFDRLKELGITHVVNCAPVKQTEESPYDPDVGVKGYLQVPTVDKPEFDILEYYPKVKTFVEEVKKDDGKVLVHCAMGINRSGALCSAYLVDSEKMDLISAMKLIKEKHGIIVLNKGFQKQLMEFAKERDLFVVKKPAKQDD